MMNPILQYIITYVPLCTTIMCQLSGAGPIYTIIREKQTSDISAAPFIMCIVCSIVWLYYGYLIDDFMILITSIIGLLCGFSYIGLFLFYTSGELRTHYIKTLIISCVVLSILIIIPLIFPIDQHKYDTYFTGFECNIISMMANCSPLATMREVIKERDSKSISMAMATAITVNNVVWIIYGIFILNKNIFLIASCTFGVAVGFLQMALVWMYPQKHSDNEYGIFAQID